MSSAFTTQEDWLLTHHTQDVACGSIMESDCSPVHVHHRFGFEINNAVPITYIFGPGNSMDSDTTISSRKSLTGISQDFDVTSPSINMGSSLHNFQSHQHEKHQRKPIVDQFGCASSLVSSSSSSSSSESIPKPSDTTRPALNKTRRSHSNRSYRRSQSRRHHATANCPF